MKKSFKSIAFTLLAGVMLCSVACGQPSTPETTKYTVTFTQDGFADVSYTVEKGDSIAEKDVPTPKAVKGYTVVWEEVSLQDIQSNIIVEAVATPNDYTVTYLLNDELGETLDVLTTQTITYDSAYELATPVRYGYSFTGWLNGETMIAQSGDAWNIDENLTLSAKWSENFYTIKFVQYDGDSQSVIVEKGKTITESAIPEVQQTKTGYELSWDVVDFSQLTQNATVNVKEEAKTYTATYVAEGYDINGTTVSLTYDALCSNLDTSIKSDSHNLVGWQYNGKIYTPSTVWNVAEDVELTPYWVEKDKVAVIFHDTNGETSDRPVYVGGTLTDIPTPSEKDGYTVDTQNWYLDEACTQVATFENIQQGFEVYAKAMANTYTVTYNVPEDATVDGTQDSFTYGAAYTLKTPVRALYSFAGWETADGKSLATSGTWSIADNVQLSAKWSENYYTITFIHDDGLTESVQVENGKTLQKDAIPAVKPQTGHTVVWEITDFSNITANTNVKEKVTQNVYKITYQLKSGESIEGETVVSVPYGTTFTLKTPKNTDKDKTFAYWKNVETGKEFKADAPWATVGDVTLEAVWNLVSDGDWTKNY
ncbi:MAG: InlB B-repeat-containing protein [Clostridia bacterium]|nr:InlB B-repeat-containing protein [Clostridia bacterium]